MGNTGEQGEVETQVAPGPPGVEENVDWIMTALLFLFPAIGGGLFGYDSRFPPHLAFLIYSPLQ